MEISVIITVYQRHKHLFRCLEGILNQSYKNFEVIVADDGSSGENYEKIKEFIEYYSSFFSIKHVWHEDKGFRKGLIINKAVKYSMGELLIFLDCDIVPEKDLLLKYIKYSNKFKKKYEHFFLTGDAIYIDKENSEKILNNPHLQYKDVINIINKSIDVKKKLFLLYRYTKFFYYKITKIKYPKGYGGNLALKRESFYSINGYDNNFHFRGEDTDFMKRLVIKGAKRISVNYSVKVFHLHHERGKEKKDIFDKERRKRLKWSYYKSHPESIVANNGIREV